MMRDFLLSLAALPASSTPCFFNACVEHFHGWWMNFSDNPLSSGTHCLTKSPLGSHVMAALTGCITKFHWSSPEKPPFCHIMALMATSASSKVSWNQEYPSSHENRR